MYFRISVKATGNVTAADASNVNAELERFSKKKGRKGSSYNTSIPSRVKEEVENTQTATEHKLQLNASNQSAHNALFYLHLSTIGNVSLITKKKICCPQSSINVADLISKEMTCCKK